MILSKRNKFIFIKGRKVASTSTEIVLSQLAGADDVITPITPIDEYYRLINHNVHAQNYGAELNELESYKANLLSAKSFEKLKPPAGAYYNHMPLQEVIELSGIKLAEYKLVYVERCPYRKILSLANMRCCFHKYVANGEQMTSDLTSLKQALEKVFENGDFKRVRNIDLYRSRESPKLTHILNYNTIEEDISNFVKGLGFAAPKSLPHAKKGMLSERFDIKGIFTKKQLQQVNDYFLDEFESFKFPIIE